MRIVPTGLRCDRLGPRLRKRQKLLQFDIPGSDAVDLGPLVQQPDRPGEEARRPESRLCVRVRVRRATAGLNIFGI